MDTQEPQHLRYPRKIRYLYIGYLVLMANAGYLAAFSHANLLFYFNILLHVVLGALLIVPFIIWARKFLKHDAYHGKPFGHNAGRLGYFFMIVTTLLGIFLAITGNLNAQSRVLYGHAITGVLACLFMISSIRRAGYNISVNNLYSYAGRWGLVMFIAAGMLPLTTATLRTFFPRQSDFIVNSTALPRNFAEAALRGSSGPFYPSAFETANKTYLKPDFLLASKSCGRTGCHADIWAQWKRSGHHNASFLNPLYRNAFTSLQQSGQKNSTRFCAGCHSPVLLASDPKTLEKDPGLQNAAELAGVGCTTCHAVNKVKSTMGNAAYVLHRPSLTPIALSPLRWVRRSYEWLTTLAPRPHRKSFFRPFLADQSNAFCSTCHKIPLESPIVNAPWANGINHYDSWLYSSAGGTGALSFFKAKKKQGCVDCHMPLMASSDAGNKQGQIHSHRFEHPEVSINSPSPGGETSAPIVQIDAFAVGPFSGRAMRGQPADSQGRGGDPNFRGQMAVPLEQLPNLPGDSVAVDVVIRPLNPGHFLPFGQFESKRITLELQWVDSRERVLFQTRIGRLSREYLTPVNGKSAAAGNVLSLRGQFTHGQAVLPQLSVIPPDAAWVERIWLPVGAFARQGGALRAVISMQKIMFPAAVDGEMRSDKAAALKAVPEQQAEARIWGKNEIRLQPLAIAGGALPESLRVKLANRWNAYGAALFLREQWPEAEYAFRQAVGLNRDFTEARVNLARVFLKTSRVDSAKALLGKVVLLDPGNARAHFYLGRCYKHFKKYSRALKHLRIAHRKMPDDLVVLEEIGHIQYLQKAYKKAIRTLRKVILKQPENLMAHYYRMLANRDIGKQDKFRFEAELFEKYARGARVDSLEKFLELNHDFLLKTYQHFVIFDSLPGKGAKSSKESRPDLRGYSP
ncbi:MAG: hypothetical protein D6814_09470 [Calditrichaeota bacterium]|nr:MAG: hypothetical protein D6814_09470 [Calditrichota bacterium]